jgi:hypothetical protein
MPRYFAGLVVVVLAIFVATCAASEAAIATRSQTACTCRCCYRGDCTDVPGTTADVADCGSCSTAVACQGLLEAARLVMSAGDRVPSLSCVALAAAERTSCNSTSRQCARSTSLTSRCVDRGGRFQRWSCVAWVAATAVAIGAEAWSRFRPGR